MVLLQISMLFTPVNTENTEHQQMQKKTHQKFASFQN